MLPSLPPPQPTSGAGAWLRRNLFNGIGNSIISIVTGIVVLWAGFSLLDWIFTEARWQLVWNNLRLLSLFTYPVELVWRPMLCVVLIMTLFGVSAGISGEGAGFIVRRAFFWLAGLVAVITLVALFNWESVRWLWLASSVGAAAGFFLGRAMPQLSRFLAAAWVIAWFLCLLFLLGIGGEDANHPFSSINSNFLGGIALSLLLSITGIVVSYPLGIALALGRESKFPIIKGFCIIYIEIIRGAPLVAWLFIASVFLPLAVTGFNPSGLARAQVAIILFAAAYMAENVRGGLQALPKGQSEAAHALGLTPWDSTRLIILPQALRAVIPPIVGLFIGLFKDTTLVTVVALSDVFATAQKVAQQPEALLFSGGIVRELFVFMAIFFWFFTYRMSVASRQLEDQLGLGTR